MSNAHNDVQNNAHAHGHAHPTVELTKASQHAHDTHNDIQPYPVIQESSQYTHNNNTHKTGSTHPHPAVQPIEVSQYTYDTSELPAVATHDQTFRQHSVASPPQPTQSRIHPVETKTKTEHAHPHFQEDHKKQHDNHNDTYLLSEHDHHAESHPHHKPEAEHAHTPEPEHAHNKPEHHHSTSSPSSTIESDSVQVSPVFGNAERRQSWSKDEMKRGVIQDLLEKGKGKQAKGGYSSTSGGDFE